MVSKHWAELVNSLADRGIPLYVITDPLDEAGLPSWAVLGAVMLVVFAILVFSIFPVAKAGLTISTTTGAKVIVGYGEEKLTSTAGIEALQFSVPLGTSVNVKITKDGCEAESIEIAMLDHYTLEKLLVCD